MEHFLVSEWSDPPNTFIVQQQTVKTQGITHTFRCAKPVMNNYWLVILLERTDMLDPSYIIKK